jgi:hypothetical protein
MRVPVQRALATALLAFAALAACVRAPPADLARDPRTLLAEVRSEQDKVKRVRGRARVSIHSPRASGSANEWIAAEKPDRVHLETLDFFGNVAAALVADGRRFALYDARTATFYRGEPTPENISRLLPVALAADELASILCGSAPILRGDPLSVEVKDGLLYLTIASADRAQRLAIGEQAAIERAFVRRIARAAGGLEEAAPIYDLDLSHFRSLGTARFPVEARLDAPLDKARIELSWSDVELNGPPQEALFHLEPPKGAKIVELSPGASVPELDIPLSPPEKRGE